jgi:hypothetical protein
MTIQAYPATTSVPAGGSIDFHLNDSTGVGLDATMTVTEWVTGSEVFRQQVHAGAFASPEDPSERRGWPVGVTLHVPDDWTSGLYRAEFTPRQDSQGLVDFVVRAAQPAAPILVALPFPTWHAYAYAGTPGASPYWNEQADRGHRVSLQRPMDGLGSNEEPALRWLHNSGLDVEYCSLYDLHHGADLLRGYQLLVSIGHDEYWTAGMRDAVENFVADGGNVAFFSGNTCWWQFRLEDDDTTFVCYRDAAGDPESGKNNRLVTVEWSSTPVNRPENSLTGVSFRRGAGCWGDGSVMAGTSWTVRFRDHWVFANTGLANGATFGTGTVGYETDAAETVDESGIPRVTGRDGTPHTFVVLATADLSSWRTVGQGGSATMGVYRAPGGGTVFTAASVGWCGGLDPHPDPVVVQVTRNVLTTLSRPYPDRAWERIGNANVTAMVACENRLFAADHANSLWVRDPVGQNLYWTAIGSANNVRALAAPREAMGGQPIALYALTSDGNVWRRAPVTTQLAWTLIGTAAGAVAVAMSYESFFVVRGDGTLAFLALSNIRAGAPWTPIGDAADLTVMTNLNGRLYAVRDDGVLVSRPALCANADWTTIGEVPGTPTALAGYAGKLFLANTAGELHWRDAIP